MEVKNMDIIKASNMGWSFHGHPGDAKRLVEALSDMAVASGMDIPKVFSDFMFDIEVEYQLFYELDEDDWGFAEGVDY